MSSSPVCITLWLFWSFSSWSGRLCSHLDSSRLLSLSLVILSLSCLHFIRICLCVFSCFVFLCSYLLLFFHLFMVIFAALSRLWCKFVSISGRLCLLVFSGLQPVFFPHSFIWSFVLVVWFFTLIVSHPLKIFLLVIFWILSSSFLAFVFFPLGLSVVTLGWGAFGFCCFSQILADEVEICS